MNLPKQRGGLRSTALVTSVIGLLCALGAIAPNASATSGNYLQNQYTGLCMSIPGDNVYNGAPIDQWGCGGYPDQHWAFE